MIREPQTQDHFDRTVFCVITFSLCLSVLICNMETIIIISTSNSCCEGYLKLDRVCKAVMVLSLPKFWRRGQESFGSSHVNSAPEGGGQALVIAFTSWLFTSKQLFQCLPPVSQSPDCIVTTYANRKITWIFSSKLLCFLTKFLLSVLFVFVLKTAENFFKGKNVCIAIRRKKIPWFVFFIVTPLCAWLRVGLQKM